MKPTLHVLMTFYWARPSSLMLKKNSLFKVLTLRSELFVRMLNLLVLDAGIEISLEQ